MSKYKYALLSILVIIIIVMVVFNFREANYSKDKSGPHGGKMLTKDNIAAEFTIIESGQAPRFRVYLYKDAKLLKPTNANLVVTLKRFNDDVNTIRFETIDDYLQSREEIEEPHSFIVDADLTIFNKNIKWQYENIEGRLTLSPKVISSSGIKTAIAGSATIEKKLSVIGKIAPNGDALSSIYPRFAGIIKEMKKNLGASVEKGEVIAIVESNESLHNYTITSPITGTIIQKHVIVGDMIKEDKPIYQVADLSTVWADLTLYRKDAPLIKKDMPTLVSGDNGLPQESGVINYISPLGIEDSQTILARSVLHNKNQEWIPGMYVNATITYLQKSVPVAIELSAVQRLHDGDVVFVQRKNSFEATPVTLGERNGTKVEVLSGLKAGQSYVVTNSFLLKAELSKSEAGHDH